MSRPCLDWLLRYELAVVTLCFGIAFASIPVSLGHLGLGWDALNHHIYLGWVADQTRFENDYFAASSQSYQAPYAYWPVYKLALSGVSGTTAGVCLAILASMSVPPIGLMAKACMPGVGWFDLSMRCMAVGLAFMSALVLSLLGSTHNDLLGAIPLLWSLALALQGAVRRSADQRWQHVVLSAVLAGIAVTLKISNGPLALILPLLWFFQRSGTWLRVRDVALGCFVTLVAFAVSYAPWGWHVWQQFGNPIYPHYDAVFEPLRSLIGWKR